MCLNIIEKNWQQPHNNCINISDDLTVIMELPLQTAGLCRNSDGLLVGEARVVSEGGVPREKGQMTWKIHAEMLATP